MGEEPDIDDRIEALRVPIDREVEVRREPGGEWIRESAGNISLSGLFIHTEEVYEPGTLLDVRLRLREGEPQVRARARVLWQSGRGAGAEQRGIGTRFVDLDLESKYAISCLVERYGQLGDLPFHLPAPAASPPRRPVRRSALSLTLAFLAGLAIGWLGNQRLAPSEADSVLPATERSGMRRSAAAEPPPVEETVSAWALAWSQKDVERYLGFYSSSFEPPSGLTLETWKASRRQRLSRPGNVEVGVSALEIEAVAAGRAIARFDQTYASPGYRDRVAKRLELVLEEPGWRVVREETVAESER